MPENILESTITDMRISAMSLSMNFIKAISPLKEIWRNISNLLIYTLGNRLLIEHCATNGFGVNKCNDKLLIVQTHLIENSNA